MYGVKVLKKIGQNTKCVLNLLHPLVKESIQVAMLPFILKIADQPIERLQRINDENQPIDVDVQVELYSREIGGTDMERTAQPRRLSQLILQEATENAYTTFITFLQDNAESEAFSAV